MSLAARFPSALRTRSTMTEVSMRGLPNRTTKRITARRNNNITCFNLNSNTTRENGFFSIISRIRGTARHEKNRNTSKTDKSAISSSIIKTRFNNRMTRIRFRHNLNSTRGIMIKRRTRPTRVTGNSSTTTFNRRKFNPANRNGREVKTSVRNRLMTLFKNIARITKRIITINRNRTISRSVRLTPFFFSNIRSFKSLNLILRVAKRGRAKVRKVRRVLRLSLRLTLFIKRMNSTRINPHYVRLLNGTPNSKSIINSTHCRNIFPDRI